MGSQAGSWENRQWAKAERQTQQNTVTPTEESGCQIGTTLVEISPQIGFFLPVIPFTDDLVFKIKQSLAWLISLKRN